MRVITWNLNSRTNKQDLTEQCDYLRKGDFDIITLQEVLLGSQGFIKDPDHSIEELLNDNNASIISFARYKVGEGIEIEAKDFAAEVAEQLQ